MSNSLKTGSAGSFFMRYKSPVGILLAVIIAGGLVAYRYMKMSLLPEITFPKIKIIADAGQQPVDKMMLSVTRPLELAIKKTEDVEVVRSTTNRGSCEISAFLNWNADINMCRQRIESAINEIRNDLPPGTNITVQKMSPVTLAVIGYTVESSHRSPIDMRLLAEYTIKPYLSQVNGVSEVFVMGGKRKEYRITPDQQKMSMLGLTPDILNRAIASANFVLSNGYLTDYRRMYLTVTDAQIDNIQKLENIVVRNDGRRIIRLKDIATVSIQGKKEYIRIRANNKEALLIAVFRQPNTNVVEMTKQMSHQVEELKKILPRDVIIEPYYLQADFIATSIRSITDSVWIGLALAIIIAILFLRSFKPSITILITIPVTLLLSITVLYALGETFNIMTIGAIAAAIGLIVDDAVVVVEQIHRTHEENPGEPTPTLVQRAIKYLFPAMVGSSLSTIVIFLPFVLMSGVAGAYFKVLTSTMMITLVCSFFVTWIGLPVVYLLLSKTSDGSSSNVPVRKVREQKWVIYFIRRPWLSFIFMGVLILSVILILPRLQTGFLPEMDEGTIVMDYTSPPGTSLDETDRILCEVEKMLAQVPEVEGYSRRTGTEMGFFITEPNSGDYLIHLRKNRKRSTEEVISDIRERVEASQPALEVDFGQIIGDMLGDLMASVKPVEIKIFGSDRAILRKYSQQIAGIVSKVKGTADVFNGVVIAGPSIDVEPDYVRLAQYGLTPLDLQQQMQMSLEGLESGTVYDRDQFTPVRIAYEGNVNLSATDLGKLQIFLPDGKLKPVHEFASVKIKEGDAELQRENLQNMGVVTARLTNRDLGSVIRDIRKEIGQKINLPEGYSIVFGGAYKEQQQAFDELLLILITAILLVFAVILFLYHNVKVAFTILLVAVLGIAGSLIALFVTGTPLNVGSYTGLIMIVGIIGENAIFTYLQFRESYLEFSKDEAIKYAISTRLRPKLMTALGAIMALLPVALGIGTGAQMHQPLGIAIIGGFVFGLPLLLIVLPTLLRLI